jgi:hypothetical protein
MRTQSRADLGNISPERALEILREGNLRFVNNLKANRNLLQQVNETSEGQYPFALIRVPAPSLSSTRGSVTSSACASRATA